MTCDCKDWEENIEKVNGPIMLQSIRAGRDLYTGKPFQFCPWCGNSLRETEENNKLMAYRVHFNKGEEPGRKKSK